MLIEGRRVDCFIPIGLSSSRCQCHQFGSFLVTRGYALMSSVLKSIIKSITMIRMDVCLSLLLGVIDDEIDIVT
jgi:hypothetical protein